MAMNTTQTKKETTWKKNHYKWIYLQNRIRFSDTESKLMVTKVGRSANLGLKDTQYSINYEFGINRYTVLYKLGVWD